MSGRHFTQEQTFTAARHHQSILLLIAVLLSCLQASAATSRSLTQSAVSLFDQISRDLAPYKEHGISASMIQGVYCGIRDPGFRVQIKNQQIFVVGEVQGFQSRNRNIKLALVDVASSYGALPDVDFVIGTYDWTATTVQTMPEFEAGGPVLAQAKMAEHTSAILYPDHTFIDWQEADTTSWQREQWMMQRAAAHHPWMDRDASLLFRGSNLTGNRHIAGGLVPNAELDVRVWDWVQEPQHEHFVGLPQHCNRKYLLNWPGNSYSARLKYLLLCGSVVIHSDNGWYEFFYHMLKHEEQYVRIEPLTTAKDLHHDLADLIRRLQADQVHSRQIAEAGQQFARETLSFDNIKEYWHRLLHEYAALQNNEVVLHHDAVPLGFSVSHPRYINLEDRHGCPKRNPDAVPHAAAEFLPAKPGVSSHTGPLAS